MSGGEAADEPVVELIDVHKSFRGLPVLRGVTLEVRSGETLVIIGRSGTGKSVTLRHIVGLTSPDTGIVRVFGREISELSRRELAKVRLRIGFLFQSGALLAWMTVEENVALPLVEHHRELSKDEVRDRVIEKLRLVGLESARDKLPSEISGGMKKRAALARAIVLDPVVILYDEPTSGLDPVISSTIDELINRTKEVLGPAQIVVTHDMESAYAIADRIALLAAGQVIVEGTPEEIRASDDPLVQQFIHGRTTGPLEIDS